jgi:hypothetical protein
MGAASMATRRLIATKLVRNGSSRTMGANVPLRLEAAKDVPLLLEAAKELSVASASIARGLGIESLTAESSNVTTLTKLLKPSIRMRLHCSAFMSRKVVSWILLRTCPTSILNR